MIEESTEKLINKGYTNGQIIKVECESECVRIKIINKEIVDKMVQKEEATL